MSDRAPVIVNCAAHPDIDLHVALNEQGNLVFGVNGTARKNMVFRMAPGDLIGKLGLTPEQCFGKGFKAKHRYDPCLTSKKKGWNTPLPVLEPIREHFGQIGLDPCSNSGSIVNAKVEWILERDGDSLLKSWAGYGLAFVNWAYGTAESPQGAKKCAEEGAAGVELIQLCKAAIGTRWFRTHTMQAKAVGVWNGRLKFGGGADDEQDNTAPFESALAYWGPNPETFIRAFEGRITLIKAP